MQNIITLEEFIIRREKLRKGTGEFSQIIRDIALAARIVHFHVNRAGLADILSSTGRVNVQGEEVQKLDEFANERFIEALSRGGQVSLIASEENEDIVRVQNSPDGKYVVLIDPLDGSSNIDVNIPIGTIFAIYKRQNTQGEAAREEVMQPGKNLLAAGYVLYGSSTMLVYSAGNGVNGFTLDSSYGDFFLSHPDIRIPDKIKYYSYNGANYYHFTDEMRAYIDDLRKRAPQEKISLRYVGSLVADFHRNLIKGGLFMYPGTKEKPQGKLRLLYEGNPMAFLAKNAGGYASNGEKDILELTPTELHQRTPLFIGPAKEVKRIEMFLQKEKVLG